MILDRRAELGGFLKSRRARLRPGDLGLPSHGGRRRVPGVRREELALTAGVSVDHYIRLEQGRELQFSASVLDAVARVLRLDKVEHEYLYRLARPWPDTTSTPRGQAVRPGLRRLLAAMTDVPAYVIGRAGDVLAWNDLGAALITDFAALPPFQRNLARLVVVDPQVSALYADWPAKVRDIAAYLRLDAARHPDDARTRALLAELCAASPEFRAAWDDHDLNEKTHGGYVYLHPQAGRLELGFEALRLPDDPDQALIVHTAPDGSDAVARLLSVSAAPAA
ncbi:helix-turn-helix domain-containing protein [Actinoplanes sp. NPDC051859]|uniref:MmyB family transcriptional regulator n=1 Tax=Actinoplanes sp. NPDC051859 TaxID=3363909 RepID=UPI0037ABA003